MANDPIIQFHVPAGMEAGVYANVLSVWHTEHEFTLDFSALGHPVGPEGAADHAVPSYVVARVKVPPTVVFDVLRTLNENLTMFEDRFGVISRRDVGEQGTDDD